MALSYTPRASLSKYWKESPYIFLNRSVYFWEGKNKICLFSDNFLLISFSSCRVCSYMGTDAPKKAHHFCSGCRSVHKLRLRDAGQCPCGWAYRWSGSVPIVARALASYLWFGSWWLNFGHNRNEKNPWPSLRVPASLTSLPSFGCLIFQEKATSVDSRAYLSFWWIVEALWLACGCTLWDSLCVKSFVEIINGFAMIEFVWVQNFKFYALRRWKY